MEDALAYISSMCELSQTPEVVALLEEMVAILNRGPDVGAYQCLYGLANLI